MAQPVPTRFLDRTDGARIAYRASEGHGPGLLWLGGFKSDMAGTKATVLHDWAQECGRAFARFDYTGHGESTGAFTDGTIGQWAEDAVAVFDSVTTGKQILLGSSMGGWIALKLALARPERVAGLFLLAPAPDFTEDLMWAEMGADAKADLEAKGQWERPSDYDDGPYIITRRLIEEARAHLLLRGPIPIRCPVSILHGQQDPDVPWGRSLTLAERLESEDVTVTFLKCGSHTLSEPETMPRLLEHMASFVERIG